MQRFLLPLLYTCYVQYQSNCSIPVPRLLFVFVISAKPMSVEVTSNTVCHTGVFDSIDEILNSFLRICLANHVE